MVKSKKNYQTSILRENLKMFLLLFFLVFTVVLVVCRGFWWFFKVFTVVLVVCRGFWWSFNVFTVVLVVRRFSLYFSRFFQWFWCVFVVVGGFSVSFAVGLVVLVLRIGSKIMFLLCCLLQDFRGQGIVVHCFLVSTRVVKVQVPLDSKICRYMVAYHIHVCIYICVCVCVCFRVQNSTLCTMTSQLCLKLAQCIIMR